MPVEKKGFDKGFLGEKLTLPKVPKAICAPLKNANGNEIIYTHYSAFVHKDRKIPLMTAVNIKGEAYNAPKRIDGEPWDYSEQMIKSYQLDNEFYGKDLNTFDRGHLVRRVDPCWGSDETAKQAEIETFRWTNCAPQHKKLNQEGGIWYELEQHVIENGVKGKIGDICVFAGPVLSEKDEFFKVKYKGDFIQVPTVFWKIIVWKKSNGKLYAVGFMMSQWEWIKDKLLPKPAIAGKPLAKKAKPKLEDEYFEKLVFSDHKTYQVPISAIEKQTGISFDWDNVTFPYKAKAFNVVHGTALKKVYPFATLHNTLKRMASVPKTGVSAAAFKRQLNKNKPMTQREVKKAIKEGLAGTLRRYSLRGIKL